MDDTMGSHQQPDTATLSAILQAAQLTQEYESGLVSSHGNVGRGYQPTMASAHAEITQAQPHQAFTNTPLDEIVEIRLQFTTEDQAPVSNNIPVLPGQISTASGTSGMPPLPVETRTTTSSITSGHPGDIRMTTPSITPLSMEVRTTSGISSIPPLPVETRKTSGHQGDITTTSSITSLPREVSTASSIPPPPAIGISTTSGTSGIPLLPVEVRTTSGANLIPSLPADIRTTVSSVPSLPVEVSIASSTSSIPPIEISTTSGISGIPSLPVEVTTISGTSNISSLPVDISTESGTTTNSETQSLSWSELSLEMLANLVTKQVIQVSQLEEFPAGHGKCQHMTGVRWEDLLDMIINNHNAACMQQTGVTFGHNTVKVGLRLEAGGVDIGMKPIYTGVQKTSVGVQTVQEVKESDDGNEVEEEGPEEGEDVNDDTNDPDWSGGKIDEVVTLKQSERKQKRLRSTRSGGSHGDEKDSYIDDKDADNDDDDADNDKADGLIPVKLEKVENMQEVSQKLAKCRRLQVKDDKPVKGYPAKCQICAKRFKSRTSLKRHMIVHEPNHNKHPCKYCSKVCKTLCYLERHMAAHFKPKKPKKSQVPSKVSNTSTSGNQRPKGLPRAIKREKAPTTCSTCGKTFTVPRNLKRHEKIHEKETNFPCEHCDKVCKSAHYLQLHMMIHAQEKRYKCADCGQSFGQKYKFKQHLARAHNKYEQHQCDVCGLVYKNKETLEDHRLEHTSKKSYLCDLCGKSFTRPSVYRLHMAYHNARANPNSFNCGLCPKSYHSKGLLNKHMRSVHIGERNFKCQVCGTGFFTKQQQRSHEQVHQEKTTHICTFCNKGFAQKHTLLAHKRMHMGIRPFICQYCGKGFTSKGFLAKHEKIHGTQVQPERPFQCKQCNASFANKTAWTDHEKRHAGIKDHKCQFCSVGFVTKGDLIRHLRTHTGGCPFQCNQCNKSFAKKLELTEHEAWHGSVQVPITVTLISPDKET